MRNWINYLGYDKHEVTGSDNSRNGYSTKTIQTEDGQFEIDTPRDRNGDFDPELVKKNQRACRLLKIKSCIFILRAYPHAK